MALFGRNTNFGKNNHIRTLYACTEYHSDSLNKREVNWSTTFKGSKGALLSKLFEEFLFGI